MKALVLVLAVSIMSSASAGTESIRILLPGTIKKLLGPYPAKGSEEEKVDFDTLRHYQLTRTAEQCEFAAGQETPTLQNLFVANNGPLTKKEADRLTPGFLQIYAEAGANIYLAKKIFKRPRPYIANPEIVPCIELEGSYAYPSGHTTLARVFARTLSRIYPERAEAFMKRGDDSSMNRVIGGVHHPSDIVSGYKLGDELAKEIDDKELEALFQ